MNSNVNPIVAVVVIILVLMCSGIWMWGTGKAEEISGPSAILTDPAGHLYIQIQNQLIEHDENGIFVERHDLGQLGVDLVLGGLDFFSDGDILLRRGPDSRSILDSLRAFQRHTNRRSIDSRNPATGLHRCNLRSRDCKPFGSPTIDFKATYSVFIDRGNDDVYISDTSRHLVRKFSFAGEELAGPAEGYRFPNHLALHGEVLVIADTNHHSIQTVSAGTTTFGKTVNVVNVTPVAARNAGREWPSHFLRVGDEWWVNNMTSAMDDGGIYVFDNRWQYVREISLPRDADPISLLVYNEDILLTDWNNFRVHRLSSSGNARNDFTSAGLTTLYEESRSGRLRYLMITWSTMVLLIGAAVILVVKGTSPPEPKIEASDDAANTGLEHTDFGKQIWIEPNPDTVRKIRRGLFLAGILMAAVVGAGFYVGIALNPSFFTPGLAIEGIAALAIYFSFVWIGRVNLGTAIGLYRDRIILRDHTGHEASHSLKDAIYDGTMIATPDMAVALGTERLPIYDKDTIKSVFLSRIRESQEVSAWTMHSALIRMRHPQGVLTLAGVTFLIGVAAWSLIAG